MPTTPSHAPVASPAPICCIGVSSETPALSTPMGRAARGSRALAGLALLVLAGGLSARRLPGGVALWPAAIVPTWFGISHLFAAAIGYQGCPELGAIPSVMLGRPVESGCEPWRRLDGWIGA
jgi:hypothetical protein